MIVVHHLNESRSQRILWLLEELQLPYEIRKYQRDAQTRLAPPELKAVHPLGKAPVIVDDGRVVAESGAIIDYLIRHHGGGRLQPDPTSAEYEDYVQWLHFAEGSAMLPLLLKFYTSRLGEAAAPLHPRITSQIADHLAYIDAKLEGRDYLLGSSLSGADIQMSFVGEFARALNDSAPYPHMESWVKRFESRPAFKAAVTRGGTYTLRADSAALWAKAIAHSRTPKHRTDTPNTVGELPTRPPGNPGAGGALLGYCYRSRRVTIMKRNYIAVLVAAASMAVVAGNAFADDVKSDQPVKDSYINTKVKAELAKDKGTKARDIHVTTKDGVVMLDGTVGSAAEKELAVQDAKKVKGVLDVHNGLTVQP